MTGIFLKPKDIQIIEGFQTYIGAYKAYQTILSALGKDKGKKITISEYAKHHQITEDEVKKALSQ